MRKTISAFPNLSSLSMRMSEKAEGYPVVLKSYGSAGEEMASNLHPHYQGSGQNISHLSAKVVTWNALGDFRQTLKSLKNKRVLFFW